MPDTPTDSRPGAFPHIMLKEIYEQPEALRETIARSVREGRIFPTLLPIQSALRQCSKVIITASGSSRNAGLAGEIMVEDCSGVPVDVEYSSEYCCRPSRSDASAIVMAISQSGETSDTLAALREARSRGAVTIGVTNVADSTIAREAHATLLTYATPELAVPATKSFTTQLSLLYLFALLLGQDRHALDPADVARLLNELEDSPGVLQASLDGWNSTALEAARRFHHTQAFLYIGRAVHYAIAREGALKLKELSYTPADGYPAGELLHGPNALIGDKTVVVALVTHDRKDAASEARYRKTLAVLDYVRSHGGRVIAVATQGDSNAHSLADCTLFVPGCSELLLPILEVVPLQLLAYHVALLNGCDVDHPRNLVKAVVRP